MTVRTVLAMSVSMFLVVGAIGWASNMPKPAALVGASVVVVAAPTSQPETDPTAIISSRSVIDPIWVQTESMATAIPPRVLEAYATAAAAADRKYPRCSLGWNTLAAIGSIESGHGSHGGAEVGPDGDLVGSIIGPSLDGTSFAAVPDTDQGRWDGDDRWDHAVGPLQFLPSTWEEHGVDGNGDGLADPNNIDDAALTAAGYLCAGDRDLTTAEGWTAAILSYNNADEYLENVRQQSVLYATESSQ